ncbi:MAG: SurA N-terminal domain-containing protein, partial [Bacteroidales bacterium]|nr:SurA N-terminal domain-containing protein [Bacteroidales bacterium]
MAVLQKIRVKFGLAISIIIALALLSFIIDPSTLETALNSMSAKYDVGQIAGKRVSYTDFQENVDKFTTIHQIASGSSVQNEENQKQIRNAAWQDFLDRYMFLKNAKNAGIRVGEDEMVDLTTGNNISPVLSQNRAFFDETGAYSPDALREFVQNSSSDARLKTFWNYLQNSVMVQKYYDKYDALFAGSSIQPKLFADMAVEEANTTASVEYVMIPFDYADSTVTVTNGEIKRYYDAHKKDYKQKAGRDIEYVVYEVVPSEADIARSNDEIDALLPEFAATTNMKAFLLRNSDRSYSEYWYKKDELANNLSSDIAEFVFSGNQGISPVYKSGNLFRAVKTIATANVPDSVYVKHILLQGVDAKHVADSLCGVVAKGGNFASLATLYSADQNSADGGEMGNLGWFTQNYTIPGFEG